MSTVTAQRKTEIVEIITGFVEEAEFRLKRVKSPAEKRRLTNSLKFHNDVLTLIKSK